MYVRSNSLGQVIATPTLPWTFSPGGQVTTPSGATPAALAPAPVPEPTGIPSASDVGAQIQQQLKEIPQWVKQAAVTGWVSAAAFMLLTRLFGFKLK